MESTMDIARQRRGAAVAAAFACGLVTGGAVMLLFAPARGRETRRWIASTSDAARRRTTDFVERNQLAIDQLRRQSARRFADVRTGAAGLVERARAARSRGGAAAPQAR